MLSLTVQYSSHKRVSPKPDSSELDLLKKLFVVCGYKKNVYICLLILTIFDFNYVKCNLWQLLLVASVTYGKHILESVIMAKVSWQMKLSPLLCTTSNFDSWHIFVKLNLLN